MRVGFTGTQDGMTDEQHKALCRRVEALDVTEFHHGCCVGSDAEAFDVVLEYAPNAKVVAHPPANRSKVSENTVAFSDEVREAKPYLVRDQDIVDESDVLVATPKTADEVRRSGTWATVRMARRAGKPVVIINPDGTETEERPR